MERFTNHHVDGDKYYRRLCQIEDEIQNGRLVYVKEARMLDNGRTTICSECHSSVDFPTWNHCPYCGAKFVKNPKLRLWVDSNYDAPDGYEDLGSAKTAIQAMEIILFYAPLNPEDTVEIIDISGDYDNLPFLKWLAAKHINLPLNIHSRIHAPDVIDIIRSNGWQCSMEDT